MPYYHQPGARIRPPGTSTPETMSSTTREAIAAYIGAMGVTEGPEGTLYGLHWESQSDEGREPMQWETLLDTIEEEAEQHGLEAVLDALYIEQAEPGEDQE